MNKDEIKNHLLNEFEGVDIVKDDGNVFFVYDKQNRIPFITIVTSNKYDNHSDLDRPGVFRLNIGIGKQTFRSMFPIEEIPTEAGFDFTALDKLTPHPDYGRMYWVCILNPGEENFERVRPMLAEAYKIAVKKFEMAGAAKRNAKPAG